MISPRDAPKHCNLLPQQSLNKSNPHYMNISTTAFILIAVLGVGLFILFVGGLLVRGDVHGATVFSVGALDPWSRVREPLRPVQDLVVDFVAASNPSSHLLDFLGEHRQSASINKLRANMPFGPERVVTAIFISSVTGLIRFGRNGVSLTDAGRAVRARLNGTVEAVSAADHQELSAAIAAAKKLAVLAVETRPVQDKLMKATITRAGDMPHDVITMNSRAEIVDLETDERVDLVLVYPADANLARGRISVFHPLGAAMLGHRVGDEFEWPVPYGTRRFRVAAVHFQPEAAFAMAA